MKGFIGSEQFLLSSLKEASLFISAYLELSRAVLNLSGQVKDATGLNRAMAAIEGQVRSFSNTWPGAVSKNTEARLVIFSDIWQKEPDSFTLPLPDLVYLFGGAGARKSLFMKGKEINRSKVATAMAKIRIAIQRAEAVFKVLSLAEKRLLLLELNERHKRYQSVELVQIQRYEIYLASLLELIDEIKLTIRHEARNTQAVRLKSDFYYRALESLLINAGGENELYFRGDATIIVPDGAANTRLIHLAGIEFKDLFSNRNKLYEEKEVESAKMKIRDEAEKVWAVKQLLKSTPGPGRKLSLLKL